jgi:cell division septal protein FtsQ
MRRYKAIILFTLVLFLAFSGIVLSGYWKDRTNVKNIDVTGNMTLSKEEIFDFAKLNDSLLLSNSISLEVIETRISKHPNIKSVNATRENGTIRIAVSEKTPFALVTNGKNVFLVDDALNLYNLKKENNNIDLPVVSGLSQELDLSYLSKTDLRNLKIAQYIISKAIKIDRILYNFISEINFSDSSGITLFTSEDVTPVYLLDYGSLHYKIKGTQAVKEIDINDAGFRKTIDEKLLYLVSFLKQVIVYKSRFSFAYVDLRYKDIVVVKNNKFSTTD